MSKDRDIRRLHPSARKVAKFIAQKKFQWYYLAKWLKLSWGLRKSFYEYFYAESNSFKMQFHEKGRKWTCCKIFFLSRETLNEYQLQNGIKYMGLIRISHSGRVKIIEKWLVLKRVFIRPRSTGNHFMCKQMFKKYHPMKRKDFFANCHNFCNKKSFLLYDMCDRWENRHGESTFVFIILDFIRVHFFKMFGQKRQYHL